tara:strand:+ start:19 stop:570 length:552 start_codon:yes stop_codon:yes gene_type:complete
VKNNSINFKAVIRETLNHKGKNLVTEKDSTGDVDVDRVALYLDAITEREEMLLAIPLMFQKIMNYEDHNVSVGEFHDVLKSTFEDDDANILFTLLSRASLEAVEPEDDDERKQDEKDREDERLADEDKEASDREDDDDKYAQTLADRRRESAGAKKKLRGEHLKKDLTEALILKAVRRALGGK